MASEEAGGITHHGTVTLEIDLTRRFDLAISFIWDRTESPQPDSSGIKPKKDDFRLNLSLGVRF